MTPWEALARGLAEATRRWRLLLPLLAANLALALLPLLPLLLALSGPLGHQPWLVDLASPRWPDLIDGLVGATVAARLTGSPSAPTGPILLAAVLAALSLPAQALAYAALAGPLVEAYLDLPADQRRGARGWFWPLVRLWLLALPIQALAVLLPTILLALAGLPSTTTAGSLTPLILWLLANALFELARVALVAGERQPRRAIATAFACALRRPLQTLGLWVLLAGLGAIVLGATTAATFAPDPAAPLATLLAQQLGAALAVWEKGVRLAAQAALYRAIQRAAPTPDLAELSA